MSTLRIVKADLDQACHRNAVLDLTRSYARDAMGDGRDLPEEVQRVLVERLRAHPTTLIFLAVDGEESVGIATCFVGFSTFAARPLVNIHDLHVRSGHQHRGVARRLLEAVQEEAQRLGCCKLTLEVLEHNRPALALYDGFGFAAGPSEAGVEAMLFRQKKL